MTTLLHILQHALGRDEYGRRPRGRSDDYRNHYTAGPGHHGFDLCREAVAAGLMREHAPRALSGGDHIFTVTIGGEAYIREHSPKPPKVSRSRARYLAFLSEDSGATFGEWLRMQKHRRAEGAQAPKGEQR